MFKNALFYRIAPGWSPSLTDMEAALNTQRFTPCAATQDKSVGWIEPRGEAHGPLVESVGGQRILRLMIETKAVPGAAVRKKADEEAAKIEATIGRKPGKKETKALREDARMALLPQAFARQSPVWVWIEPEAGWLITDAASQARADDAVTALVRAFDGLALTLMNTKVTPQAAMTQWLMAESADEWPAGLCVEREGELRSYDEDKAVVRYTRHTLRTDEVLQHLKQGMRPTRLALSWEDRVGFVLTESMQLRKLDFPAARPSDDEGGFDADVALATGELRQLVHALLEALGGEFVPDGGAA